jgi:16S rRNA processing protein RimM
VPDRICVAQIGAPHGVRGEVRLWSFTTDPLAVARYGALETEDGKRSFKIETVRAASDHLVARLSGVPDRNMAETLTNLRLYVPRERLPAPEDDDTFYHADLVGLAVVDKDNTDIGIVVAIHNFGAGEIIELRLKAGGPTAMLPFSLAVVPVVDIPNGRIVIDPPEGSLTTGEARDDMQDQRLGETR